MRERFRHYTDGEYEYRIERGLENSGVRAMGCAGLRAWKLADRPIAPPRIVMTNYCDCDPQCSYDGSVHRHGQHIPPSNMWQACGAIYLPNDAEWDVAERRLLGAELLAECNLANSDAAAAARRRANSPDAPADYQIDLGHSHTEQD